ncbi:lytic transglycosylase domain-containing protein [Aromatoleum diolicum]|uniref:Transglycosylase SLT domain-containing protein n=1 Tax=Aromatoleum diolicum TaxID=75796 RepID=A0ABX1QIJ8_9RHOO|nr:lytic transglycosylase domain-containing protein [Aromatoleum diolicum]NMG77450.1 transglycosylase SLT domain-containing protein [Aromatoleum diolicum]
MTPLVPLLLAACLALPATAHAEIYMKVEADGTVMLTDEVRGSGYQRMTPGPTAAPRAVAPSTRGQPGGAAASDWGDLPFAPLVAAAAAEHDVPEALIHAVIHAESNYDAGAVSPKGAVGLMQLMPATARELGLRDARDPAANIRAGTQYLKRLLGMFDNDIALALAAYNAGPAAVARHGRNAPPYAETRRYVPRVIEHFERLRSRRGSGVS